VFSRREKGLDCLLALALAHDERRARHRRLDENP
jgi:hypothetical protein